MNKKAIILIIKILCILVLYLFITSNARAQKQNKSKLSDSIFWKSDRKLTVNDYKVKILENTCVAISNTGIVMEEINGKLTCRAVFYPKYSYLSPYILNKDSVYLSYILNHEQRHFDISEYMARELNKKLLESTKNSEKYKWFNFYARIRDILQTKYDLETDYSNNREQQAIWNDKIDEFLTEDKITGL